MTLSITPAHRRRGKLARDFLSDLVAAGPDVRAHVDRHLVGSDPGELAQRSQHGARHSLDGAPPAGMGGRDGARSGEEQREAIGGADRENHAGDAGHERIGVRVEPGGSHLRHAGAVHLTRGGEPFGIRAQGGEEPAAILHHRLGPIVGRAPEVQRVVGRLADTAAAGAEGQEPVRHGVPRAPHRHGRPLIQRPHATPHASEATRAGQEVGARGVAFRSLIVGAMMLFLAGAARAQGGSPGSTVATVGPLRLDRQALDERAEGALADFQKRLGSDPSAEIKTILRRQALEGLIRAHLLILEAKRLGITVSDAEAEAHLKEAPFFKPGGTFSEALFRKAKASDAARFHEALEQSRSELAARRLNDRLAKENLPDETRLRAAVERSLSRASVEYLALRYADFSGDHPEPRESDVLSYYTSHAGDFRRPERASLTVLWVHQSNLSDERAKPRADSLLAAVRKGASFEAAEDRGAEKRSVSVAPDDFPSFWLGPSKTNAAIFKQPAGSVFPELVPAHPGWLIVRVDSLTPPRNASLGEVSRVIRAKLRAAARTPHEERELMALYQSRRDSLEGPAFRLRYAVVDTASMEPGEPTAADLDRFYRGHLADYTAYDAGGSLVSRSLEEVRGDVRQRWRSDRRLELARSLAERLESAWSRGRRDRALERSATRFRDIGPLPLGAPVEEGAIGKVLADSLEGRGGATGVGVARVPGGTVVFDIYERIESYTPTFEQVRPMLAAIREDVRARNEETGARKFFASDPRRFATGKTVHFTRVVAEPLSVIDVPLTREEVERYHRDHISKYSAPEQVHARHILVSPSGPGEEADRAARAKAEELLRRIRAGEDIADLARQYTDDPATKAQGGDLGYFARGTMLDAFERAAFTLEVGEVSEPVKTEVGYHIIKVIDHQPMVAEPLVRIYPSVGADAANEKAQRMARHMADSLCQAARTPAQARAAAEKLHLDVIPYRHVIGDRNYPPEMLHAMISLEQAKPGEIVPEVLNVPGLGSAFQWVDSVTASTPPAYEQVRPQVLMEYRREVGRRALEAKRAELDSLMRAGWSIDSLGALWGGLETAPEVAPGRGVAALGSPGVVDSLIFGSAGLEPGRVSDWIDLGVALARFRIDKRIPPGPSLLAARLESERRTLLENHLFDYYERLKRRYSVRILDPELRGVTLPPLPTPLTL